MEQPQEVVDLCDSDESDPIERRIAEVREVCPSIPRAAVAQLLLETRDPVEAINKLLDRQPEAQPTVLPTSERNWGPLRPPSARDMRIRRLAGWDKGVVSV